MSETTTVAEYAAQRLRIEMARRDLSNTELAELLGVSDMWVSRRRRGQTRMTTEDLDRLAVAFGIPPAAFLPDWVAAVLPESVRVA